MGYNVILADLDDTLFDFTASARQALAETLAGLGLTAPAGCVEAYLAINQQWWERFERGEIPKSAIYAGRFADLFARYGLDADPAEANARYKDRLWRHRNFMPGCEALLRRLRPACEIYVLTNGTADTQRLRIADSGLAGYFDGMFISEELGCRKPERRFFDQVLEAIGPEKRARAIVLGDSLTSDMQGGRNAGLPTCFYGDPARADGRCDYVISDLLDFPAVIGLAD